MGCRHFLLPVEDVWGSRKCPREGWKGLLGASASLSRIMEDSRDLLLKNCSLSPLHHLTPNRTMREELPGSEDPSSCGKLNQKKILSYGQCEKQQDKLCVAHVEKVHIKIELAYWRVLFLGS